MGITRPGYTYKESILPFLKPCVQKEYGASNEQPVLQNKKLFLDNLFERLTITTGI